MSDSELPTVITTTIRLQNYVTGKYSLVMSFFHYMVFIEWCLVSRDVEQGLRAVYHT